MKQYKLKETEIVINEKIWIKQSITEMSLDSKYKENKLENAL